MNPSMHLVAACGPFDLRRLFCQLAPLAGGVVHETARGVGAGKGGQTFAFSHFRQAFVDGYGSKAIGDGSQDFLRSASAAAERYAAIHASRAAGVGCNRILMIS